MAGELTHAQLGACSLELRRASACVSFDLSVDRALNVSDTKIPKVVVVVVAAVVAGKRICVIKTSDTYANGSFGIRSRA